MRPALLAALLLIPAAPLVAQPPDPALAERIDPIFADYDAVNTPGCSLGVYQDDAILYSRGYGMANLEYDLALTPQSVFRIGSTSKQFTAATIALLAQDGLLSLDDDIRKFFPEFPEHGEPITVRELIHHTSGLRDYLSLAFLAGLGDHYFNEDVLALLARQKTLNFEPGEKFLYSNSGYFLLSQIVEKVTGETLAETARKRIFEPLGMRHTHFHDDPTRIVKQRADGYSPTEDGGFSIDMTTLEMVGDGGVFTTVEDLLLWDRNFYDNRLGGGGKLIAQLYERGRLDDGETLDYAFGLFHDTLGGLPMIAHGGAFVGFRAEMLRVPGEHLSVAVLCNRGDADPSRLARRVAEELLGEEIAALREETANDPSTTADTAPSAAVPAALMAATDLERFVGDYWNAAELFSRKVAVEDGHLVYRRGGGPATLLAPLGEDRFRMLDVPVEVEIRFEPVGAKAPEKMTVLVAGDEPRSLERFEKKPPTAAELAAHAGTYVCDELGAAHRIEVGDGALIVHIPKVDPIPLERLFGDIWNAATGGVVRFERGASGEITGFVLDGGRARGLRFVKTVSNP